MDKPTIGITTGDLNGVGLETIIKVFSDTRMTDLCTPVLFGSNKVINYYRKILSDYPLHFNSIKRFDSLHHKQFNVFNCWEEEVSIEPGEQNEIGGKYAIRSLQVATQCLLDNEIDALVTAPICKSNTYMLPNFNYTGHTPYLKDKFQVKDVVMMLYSNTFKVALISEHIPLNQVSESINSNLIINKTMILHDTLVKDFGIDTPKIAILALNPHASDNGLIGHEEEKVLLPAIEALKNKGIWAFGPYSADGYFGRLLYRKFDATLAMYHDQGLIPFKMLCSDVGVNYTCGLPIIRTSPDHGVAFDIAGKGIADENSLRQAVFEAINIWRQRNQYAENTANTLVKSELPKEH